MPRNHEIFAERKKQKEQESKPQKESEIVVIEDADEVPSYRELDEYEGE